MSPPRLRGRPPGKPGAMDIPGKTEEMLNQMIVGSWVTQAIYVAAEIGIADFLANGPRAADELARETQTHRA